MATFKLICTVVFLLAIVFPAEIISIEGSRHLRTPKMNMKSCENHASICDKNARETGRIMSSSAAGSSGNHHDLNLRHGILDHHHEVVPESVSINVEAASGLDDFRSTTPGHSPGAGHSNGPRTVDPNL